MVIYPFIFGYIYPTNATSSLGADPVSTPTPPPRIPGRKNSQYPAFAQVLVVEKPHERNPPVAPGVIPAYDQALAYIRLDLGLDAAIVQVEASIDTLRLSIERGGGYTLKRGRFFLMIEDVRKWLDVTETINLPEVRLKAANGMDICQNDLVGGAKALLVFSGPAEECRPSCKSKEDRASRGLRVLCERADAPPVQFHPEQDPYHLVNASTIRITPRHSGQQGGSSIVLIM
ncbi:hypothetical protein EDB86DRAFT_2828845 [Lactarius hatsudake]|nr:hypothetical protein EDB86DRAFT_2828845 [Lactarius hatsudake]